MNRDWIKDLEHHINVSEIADTLPGKNLHEIFPRSYRDDFQVIDAFEDYIKIGQLLKLQNLQVKFTDDTQSHRFYIKLYCLDHAVILSKSMSILESMGLIVLLEKPYQLNAGGRTVWLHHFTLRRCHELCAYDHGKMPRYFRELFISVWNKESENDAFNQLLFSTCLKKHNITILRAYTAYLHQINFPYSQALVIDTFNTHPLITTKLIKLFLYKFDPSENLNEKFDKTYTEYMECLNAIESLDQDLIFKRFLNLIDATVRTNYFQPANLNNGYISFKFKSGDITRLPEPHPLYEIFVYSSRFEGIHLRGGKVARGGLRWSDRKEDYRTEVLGLMKAQMVKNAVIVPAGSKGGFITKQTAKLDREETFEEVKTCYQLYIHALLELTDNMLDGKVKQPNATKRHDHDDPYLVVAADKGTATFSDTANLVSEQHEFWLQDAFASGGSAGYDHKVMGITARGAWESVKRHFRG